MPKRFLSVWFPFLSTESLEKEFVALKSRPFVEVLPQHGREVIMTCNALALDKGIVPGMVVADARAVLPGLEVRPYDKAAQAKLLRILAEWMIRYAPIVAVDSPDGVFLDVSGCTHIWGGEEGYLDHIFCRLRRGGYTARLGLADTIGAAWALAHFGQGKEIALPGEHIFRLAEFPPEALRLEERTSSKMGRLGFCTIDQFMRMSLSVLRRRFGAGLLQRMGQAFGNEVDVLEPIVPELPYRERLPCLEPVVTRKAIEIALEQLLAKLCGRLQREGEGVRKLVFKGYRVDGNVQVVEVGTSDPTHHAGHLFRLFGERISSIRPALGIELFVLESPWVESVKQEQESLWQSPRGAQELAEMLDTIAGRVGMKNIHRFVPQESHWPERAMVEAPSLVEGMKVEWPERGRRPLHLLDQPEPISVMVVLPDYPPLLFTHKNKRYRLIKADGPERIEREWWLEEGECRDYYVVEDTSGARYWLFRSGHYADGTPEWFLHGFFA